MKNINKKKRPKAGKIDMKADRGDILGKITKKSSSLPAPW